jgi:ABC-type uncharacterized transport system ATPase subunit
VEVAGSSLETCSLWSSELALSWAGVSCVMIDMASRAGSTVTLVSFESSGCFWSSSPIALSFPFRPWLTPGPVRSPAMQNAVEVRELRKSYDGVEAVRGISFEIRGGEVFGLLGPNGAGKTTTVEILEGYRRPDVGEVRVLGADPRRAGPDWRERIGVVPQSGELFPNLTVIEHLELFAGYYPDPRPPREVMTLVGLDHKAGSKFRTLSGGQKRRLDLGIALVGDPELLFLDEPTTGFDP